MTTLEAILFPVAVIAAGGGGFLLACAMTSGKVGDLEAECDHLAFALRDAASLLLCMGQRIAARKAFQTLGLEPDGSEPARPAVLPCELHGGPTC